MSELDLDVAVGGDLAHGRLVVVAVLLPQRLALLANLGIDKLNFKNQLINSLP